MILANGWYCHEFGFVNLLPPCVAVVELLSRVWLFMTSWTAARQTSLSFTISQSWLKLMSTKSVMPTNYLNPCRPFSSCH